MSFENIAILWLLLLLPAFLIFFVLRSMARAAAVRRIGDTELVQKLLSQISPFRRRMKAFLWLLALAALILALARPTLGTETEIIRSEGIQIIVAMDISRSMDATDVSPSRVDRAKLDTMDIVRGLEGNDFGLVVFAREAYSYMPLTFDVHAAEVFLAGVNTGMLTRQGTNIPAALEVAMGAFEHRSRAQKVIILISDGESFEGDAILAAQIAAEEGVIIYTIGYGSPEGALIPLRDEAGNLTDYVTLNDGSLVNSVLNADLLQRVAAETGGFYLQGGSDIQPLLDNILGLEEGELREEIITRPVERFGVFVALALALLSLEMLLPETRREEK
jgi:Ca-activated chloride channel family protein